MVRRTGLAWLILAAVSFGGVFAADSPEDARGWFRKGRYAECLESARKAIADGAYSDRVDWLTLEIESLMALGRYDEAAQSTDEAFRDSRVDLRLIRVAHGAYLAGDKSEQALTMLQLAYRVATSRRFENLPGPDLVALGQCLLLLGVEPRVILRDFYNKARDSDPNCRDAYLAAGELAIAKQDYELAAERYREAIKRFGDDPDAHYGLAQAFYYSDRKAMLSSLDAALHINPGHAPSLILLAEHLIDCEDYPGAAKSLDRVLAVNPWQPEAWAYRVVLANYANDPNAVVTCRAKALKFRPGNPLVDHLIGRKLSQNYRFSEGAAYQRQSLLSDPDYLPAKIQLAQDLLRLGDEQQGWMLAEEVNTKDPYNVEAYNLVNLRDAMSKFKTLSVDGFVIRMDSREAAIYGDSVIELLRRAKSKLCSKYGLKLNEPVVVELFPNQQDFAVRTFGMPGGDGYLGVCFGKVITANSPSAARPANWQSMLWHEFCHVVTLNRTGNKMPRWLSEGISVYEELVADPTWGQRMNPQYLQMIEDGALTPIGNLSAAFMNPPTQMHLQFAYYESSLAVEFLVQRYGLASLKAILADLARGKEINAAIAARAAPLEDVEKGFAAFVRKRADELAPGVDWEQPKREQVDPADRRAVAQWLTDHPNSLWALSLSASELLAERQWEQAKTPLKKLISLYPSQSGQDNAYQLLAEAHRNLGETDEEAAALGKLAALSADAADAYHRLIEIDLERQNWTQVVENGRKYLAVYPMLGMTYWRLGRAEEELGHDERAVESYQRLLQLDPGDPVDVHYRLAKLLQKRDPAAAKRHVLEALADAPRFRQGHQLLLKLTNEQGTTGQKQP